MYGPFEAEGSPKLDIVPSAWRSSCGRPFPAQIRVRLAKKFASAPLAFLASSSGKTVKPKGCVDLLKHQLPAGGKLWP